MASVMASENDRYTFEFTEALDGLTLTYGGSGQSTTPPCRNLTQRHR